MNNPNQASSPEDKPVNTNRWLFVFLAIVLLGTFIWRAFTTAHEFPSPTYRNLTIGLDLLCLIGLIGLRVQASRQEQQISGGMSLLFCIALVAGIGLFAIRMNGTESFWTGHISYGLLPRSASGPDPVAPTNPVTATGSNDAKPGTNSAPPTPTDSPSEVYKAFYAAYKNNDTETMKTLISRGLFRGLDFADKKKADERNEQTLKKVLEQPLGSSDETRNEKIAGDDATVECMSPKSTWYTRKFVKEDGKWKLRPANQKVGE